MMTKMMMTGGGSIINGDDKFGADGEVMMMTMNEIVLHRLEGLAPVS